MELGSPIEALHAALSSAQFVDMPEVTDMKRKPSSKPFVGNRSNDAEYQEWCKSAYEECTRRPFYYELHVEAMFPQTWGSTALGFGGIGGQTITPAYTIIIGCDFNHHYCVYFGGRFAYKLDMKKFDIEKIRKDIAGHGMAEVGQRGRYLKKD